jgi:hypothetical protein
MLIAAFTSVSNESPQSHSTHLSDKLESLKIILQAEQVLDVYAGLICTNSRPACTALTPAFAQNIHHTPSDILFERL